ncbi:MAG TPA: hypothetical protein VJA94_12310 [Candidatus Angelobacter sp.]
MEQSSDQLDPLPTIQAPVAFDRLQRALAEHIEDLNRRFSTGMVIVRTSTTFEVHELNQTKAMVYLCLTGKNDIQFSRFIKRDREMESGTIYVRAGQDGTPILMFPDFPHPNIQVSYTDASRRLLDASF